MAIDSGVVITVRDAVEADVEVIRTIYNHYVLNSVVTFDVEEQTHEQRLVWLRHHLQEKLPVLVAEVDGKIVGWASLSYYHSRCAYKSTVEFSVYLDHSQHGKGVGKRLMHDLLALAKTRGYHCVVGLICSENTTSLKMADSLGFKVVGELAEVGRKCDRWLNVTFVQLLLE